MLHDINLLPKKVRKISGDTIFVIVLISMAFVTTGVLLGYVFPKGEQEALKSKIVQIKEDIAQYDVAEAEYYQLMQEVTEKRVVGEALLALRNHRLDMTDFLDNIEANIPSRIILDRVSISAGTLTVDGKSESYKDISRFMVKLRNMDRVYDATFTTASLDRNEDDESYTFSLSSNIDQRDIIEELQTGNPVVNESEGGTMQ